MGKSRVIHDLRADTKKPGHEVWALVPKRAAQILQWTVKLIKMSPDECGSLVVPRLGAAVVWTFAVYETEKISYPFN
jgi:hypothetical protein